MTHIPGMYIDRNAAQRWLLFIAGHLFVLHLFAGLITWAGLDLPLRRYWHSFNLENEISLGTWFNSVLALGVSGAAYWVSRSKEPGGEAAGFRRHWLVIAVLFLLISADEVGGMHEQLNQTINIRVSLPSYLRYAWVIPAGIFVCALTLFFGRFVLKQPREMRRAILGAAAMYLTGARGFEMLGSHIASNAGPASPAYHIAVGLEELLEMLGCIQMLGATLKALPEGAAMRIAS